MRAKVLLLSAVLAAGVVVLVVLLAGNVYAALGDTAPGPLTSYGAALLRLVADGTGMVCVGALVFAAFLSPGDSGRLSAEGYSAIRTAGAAALVWALAAVALVPFDAADSSGQPVSDALHPANLLVMLDAMEEPKAWLCVLAGALVVAVGCWFTLSWRVTVALLAVAIVALLPPVVIGHTSVGDWHDVATNSILWHVVAAAVWLGTLVALLAHVQRDRGTAIRRYRRVSAVCLVVLAVSGLVDGLITARPGGVFSSGYGFVLLLKVFLTIVLGFVIVAVRRRTGTSLVQLLVAELVILAIATGASVGLTHLVPPAFLAVPATVMQTVIGYDLPDPPTFARLVFGWRPDLLLGTVAVLAIVAYVVGVRRLRARGDHWPPGRTVAWVCGWLAVLVATSSGVGRYASGTFSLHMVAHMTLNMLAPVLLVLGGPITLALRALPVAGRGNPTGPREWLVALVHSRVARLVAHPLVASVVFVGSFYGLYFSGLFGEMMLYHWAHQLMNVHFLLSGYVFYWLVIGVDRPPRQLPHLARLGMMFAVMPFHAFFGVILMSKQTVIAETFYRYLDLTWMPDLLVDQRLGGGIAWATGEIPMIVVVVALLAQWSRNDEREGRRTDRRLDNGGDDDFAAYNAMLAQLAGRER